MGEKPPPVRNLSRNLRAMKFMRRGENHLDLEAEAVDLKTKPEQWFRDVEQIPEKKLGNDASLVECMDLRYNTVLSCFLENSDSQLRSDFESPINMKSFLTHSHEFGLQQLITDL